MLCDIVLFSVLFFKQKTAYEMRISDWSSDVCSSDLRADDFARFAALDEQVRRHDRTPAAAARGIEEAADHRERGDHLGFGKFGQIGRAACRERVCQYV